MPLTTETHMTVAQFCEGLADGTILINRKYQREEGVWPAIAQSFLIETILLGMPVPKLTLHVTTDRDTRRTVSEIVDGQQRATAIHGFINDEFSLGEKLDLVEACGHTYSSLPGDLKDVFLAYRLGFDQLVNVDPETIREMFRRINSYEVPLNPEEQRHARHQGKFKWFIHPLAKEYNERLKDIGTFTGQHLVRMQDMKLLAEICHALVNGISTTNKNSVAKLYGDKDKDFPEERDFDAWLRHSFDYVLALRELHGTRLMAAFSLYSLVLAIIHAEHDVPSLRSIGDGGHGLVERGLVVTRLSDLIRTLEADESAAEPGALYKAFEKGTNVKARRETRAQHFLAAVSDS